MKLGGRYIEQNGKRKMRDDYDYIPLYTCIKF